jgi:ABC-2 type transport system ATP-binding protein
VTAIVEAREVGRWYGEVVGLNDLTVQIQPGITGLIGPNGAGKSTFMKLLVGELRPSRGTLQVLGLTPFANLQLYRKLGFCPQQDALYDHLSGREFVTVCMRLAGYDRTEARARATRAMERVGLEDAMDRRCGGYSKGMRQRTRLAQSIGHDPELLILDEPLTGLDPVARHRTLELFRELAEAGKSLLLSSHVLHEVQSLTERIVLIHRGRLLAQGSVPEVRRLLSRHPRKLNLRAREPRRLAEALLRFEHVDAIALGADGALSIQTRDLDDLFRQLPSVASELRAGIKNLESSDASLEAVFDYLVD